MTSAFGVEHISKVGTRQAYAVGRNLGAMKAGRNATEAGSDARASMDWAVGETRAALHHEEPRVRAAVHVGEHAVKYGAGAGAAGGVLVGRHTVKDHKRGKGSKR